MTENKEAFAYCEKLARSHYENFTVGSLFVPKILRRHLYSVYAFCRWSDDLGDETGDPVRAYRLLEDWENQLNACYEGKASHPIYQALQETISEFHLPKEPFWRLIQAFKQDQIKTRYQTFTELLEYCQNSANPVGHLVLYLFGYQDKKRQELSDMTCTALQLANFWQDVTVDLLKGRIYIPREDMERFGVLESDLHLNQGTKNFKELMAFEVDRTRDMFLKGLELVKLVKGVLKIDLKAFTKGGLAVLDGIQKMDYDVLLKRPVVSRRLKLKILIEALASLPFSA
ncbi:MAG: squalene synthase HpnC [Firmicutes bacterium]|nr:squalene synthase HpnC [Bacillota bacterium]